MDLTTYPLAVSPVVLLVVFLASLAMAHVVLLRLFALDEVRWQLIDYVWLSLALLGLLGAVAQNRQQVAGNFEIVARMRAESYLSSARRLSDRHSRAESALCRHPTRTQTSPPAEVFDARVADDQRTCEWFRATLSVLPKTVDEVPAAFGPGSLPSRPARSVHSPDAEDYLITLTRDDVANLVENMQLLSMHHSVKSPSEWQQYLTYIGPFLLAFALAIRITKVTGEVRIKRAKARSAT